MSRAFTKEIDDAPDAPIPDRPVSTATNYVTERGAELIEARLESLSRQLAQIPADQAAAVQRELRYWTARRATMQVVRPSSAPLAVGFGVTVALRRGGKSVQLTIVGEDEADPAAGRLAWTSPLAEALDGAERGEIIEFEAGGRTEMIEVVSISAG